MLRFLIVSLCLSSLVLAQEEICPPGFEHWPHEDCTKYWICNNGLPIVGDCPGGLYWNQNSSACDFPNNVPECSGGTRPPIGTTPPPTTTTTTPTPTTTTTTPTPTTTPTTTTPTTTPPPTTTPTTPPPTTTTVPTTTAIAPGTCPGTGIVVIPHDVYCNMYYLCVNGNRTEATCAPGLLFDPSIGQCNLASGVDCGDLITPPPATTTTTGTTTTGPTTPSPTTTTRPTVSTTQAPSDCPPTGNSQIPYPGNCTLYQFCSDGNVVGIYRCAPGTLFDSVARVCRPEGQAVCTVEPIVLIADKIQQEIEENEEGEKAAMRPHHQWTDAELKELGKIWAPFRLD